MNGSRMMLLSSLDAMIERRRARILGHAAEGALDSAAPLLVEIDDGLEQCLRARAIGQDQAHCLRLGLWTWLASGLDAATLGLLLDDTIERRIQRLTVRIGSADVDAAIRTMLEIGDALEAGAKSGALAYDEFVRRTIEVRTSIIRAIGDAKAALIFLGEMDLRSERDGSTFPSRETFAARVRALLPSC